MKPNFLIIGAAKSGTTSLYHYLNQQPQVCLSNPKETRFFELEYDKGLDFYWQTYFQHWADQPAIGEASPCYLYLPYVPARIKAALPEAKLLVILRNPIERAFSHWWMTYSLGVEKLSFPQALKANLAQIQTGFTFSGPNAEQLWRDSIYWGTQTRLVERRWYLDMGHYAQQLEHYFTFFPRTQLKILWFEDLRRDSHAVVMDTAKFIGIRTDIELKDDSPQMVATPRIGLPLLKLAQILRIQQRIPQPLRRRVAKFLARFGSKPTMDAETRAWLVSYYTEHNRALEQIVDKDLSQWDQ